MKIRVSSVYVCFVMGVLLVGALTLIEVPCPICGGTGVITGAKGLEVKGVEGELIDLNTLDVGCGALYNKYTYAVKISLVNEATAPSYGAISVTFHDPKGAHPEVIRPSDEEGADVMVVEPAYPGPTVAAIPVFVEIPAETAQTIEEIIWFEEFWVEQVTNTHNISADTAGKIVCPYCDGTGTVPIIEWFRD